MFICLCLCILHAAYMQMGANWCKCMLHCTSPKVQRHKGAGVQRCNGPIGAKAQKAQKHKRHKGPKGAKAQKVQMPKRCKGPKGAKAQRVQRPKRCKGPKGIKVQRRQS